MFGVKPFQSSVLCSVAILSVVWVGTALGEQVDNSTVTITDAANAFGGGFAASNAIDTGSGFATTDYASSGQGANTFIDFDFNAALTFTQVQYTDRVTSAGTFGTADFVTGFDLIFSTDAVFGNGDDTIVTTTGIPIPTSPSSIDDFKTTVNIPSITARYLRWDVTTAPNLSNAGASNFAFTVVPEPGSLALLSLAGLLVLRTRR